MSYILHDFQERHISDLTNFKRKIISYNNIAFHHSAFIAKRHVSERDIVDKATRRECTELNRLFNSDLRIPMFFRVEFFRHDETRVFQVTMSTRAGTLPLRI